MSMRRCRWRCARQGSDAEPEDLLAFLKTLTDAALYCGAFAVTLTSTPIFNET
jgi:hypothetical protein